MLGLFVFGSFAFWTLLVVASIGLFFLVESEKSVWSMIVLVATLAAFQFLGDLGLIAWVLANPLLFAGLCCGYLVAGGLWSFVKWYFYLLDKRDDFMEARENFINWYTKKRDTATKEDAVAVWTQVRKEGKKNLPDDVQTVLKDYYDSKITGVRIPKARDRKSKIVNWMAYWPWSMLGSLLTDFLRRVFNSLYTMLSGVFESISRHVFRDVVDEV